MMSERTAAWAMTATTADLLWHFYNYQVNIRAMRARIVVGDLSPATVDFYAREVQADVDAIRAIVAELRRRGHSVDWED